MSCINKELLNKTVQRISEWSAAASAGELDLAQLGIIVLPTNDILRLTDIRSMDVSYNLLEDIPTKALEHIGRWLEEFNLSHNNFKVLDRIGHYFASFSKLRVLSLAHNRLQLLPNQICSLPALESLDVSHNALVRLPSNIGHLAVLKRLDASHNNISALPVSISSLEQLEELHLSDNILFSTEGRSGNNLLTGLKSLKHLDLSDNEFEFFPVQMFYGLEQLEYLDVSYNDIASLPTSIEKLRNLKKLDVSHNSLNELPATLFRLRDTLCELYYFSNPLRSLPAYFHQQPSGLSKGTQQTKESSASNNNNNNMELQPELRNQLRDLFTYLEGIYYFNNGQSLGGGTAGSSSDGFNSPTCAGSTYSDDPEKLFGKSSLFEALGEPASDPSSSRTELSQQQQQQQHEEEEMVAEAITTIARMRILMVGAERSGKSLLASRLTARDLRPSSRSSSRSSSSSRNSPLSRLQFFARNKSTTERSTELPEHSPSNNQHVTVREWTPALSSLWSAAQADANNKINNGGEQSSSTSIGAPCISTSNTDNEDNSPTTAPEDVIISVWDLPGSIGTRSVLQCLYSASQSLYFVVFSLKLDISSVHNCIIYYLEAINASAPGAHVVLVGTHVDAISTGKSRAQIAESLRTKSNYIHHYITLWEELVHVQQKRIFAFNQMLDPDTRPTERLLPVIHWMDNDHGNHYSDSTPSRLIFWPVSCINDHGIKDLADFSLRHAMERCQQTVPKRIMFIKTLLQASSDGNSLFSSIGTLRQHFPSLSKTILQSEKFFSVAMSHLHSWGAVYHPDSANASGTPTSRSVPGSAKSAKRGSGFSPMNTFAHPQQLLKLLFFVRRALDSYGKNQKKVKGRLSPSFGSGTTAPSSRTTTGIRSLREGFDEDKGIIDQEMLHVVWDRFNISGGRIDVSDEHMSMFASGETSRIEPEAGDPGSGTDLISYLQNIRASDERFPIFLDILRRFCLCVPHPHLKGKFIILSQLRNEHSSDYSIVSHRRSLVKLQHLASVVAPAFNLVGHSGEEESSYYRQYTLYYLPPGFVERFLSETLSFIVAPYRLVRVWRTGVIFRVQDENCTVLMRIVCGGGQQQQSSNNRQDSSEDIQKRKRSSKKQRPKGENEAILELVSRGVRIAEVVRQLHDLVQNIMSQYFPGLRYRMKTSGIRASSGRSLSRAWSDPAMIMHPARGGSKYKMMGSTRQERSDSPLSMSTTERLVRDNVMRHMKEVYLRLALVPALPQLAQVRLLGLTGLTENIHMNNNNNNNNNNNLGDEAKSGSADFFDIHSVVVPSMPPHHHADIIRDSSDATSASSGNTNPEGIMPPLDIPHVVLPTSNHHQHHDQHLRHVHHSRKEALSLSVIEITE